MPGSNGNGSWIYPPVWAPNGLRIAYIEEHEGDGSKPVEPTAALMTVDPNGGGISEVLNDSRLGPALWWTPDGRILFAYREDPASKKDNFGVYSIRIDERTGKATGPPQPITQMASGWFFGEPMNPWKLLSPNMMPRYISFMNPAA